MKNTKKLNEILTQLNIADVSVIYDRRYKNYVVVHVYEPVEGGAKYFHNMLYGNHKKVKSFIEGFFSKENLERIKNVPLKDWGLVIGCPKNPAYGQYPVGLYSAGL